MLFRISAPWLHARYGTSSLLWSLCLLRRLFGSVEGLSLDAAALSYGRGCGKYCVFPEGVFGVYFSPGRGDRCTVIGRAGGRDTPGFIGGENPPGLESVQPCGPVV